MNRASEVTENIKKNLMYIKLESQKERRERKRDRKQYLKIQ